VQQVGRGCVELDHGHEDGVNLRGELAGGSDDDALDMMALGRLSKAQEFLCVCQYELMPGESN
jgi:hypothetical protein